MDEVKEIPIAHVPTSTLIIYICQWVGMYREGKAVTYKTVPPYSYTDIMFEMKTNRSAEWDSLQAM